MDVEHAAGDLEHPRRRRATGRSNRDQLTRWGADAAALSEFRGTQPSRTLAGALAARGLRHQRTTADVQAPRENALLLASRWPLRRLRLSPEPPEPRRWLLVRVAAPHPFAFGLLHAPNYVTGRNTLSWTQCWRRPNAREAALH